MKGSTGCPTRIITAVPRMRELAKGEKRELSKRAKFRLEVIEYYVRSSAGFSKTGRPDAAPACRHFCIHRSYFYRWLARFDARRLFTLENRPPAPKKKREPEYSRELAGRVREIREEKPTYSRDKTRAALLRETGADDVPGAATIGRLINRENGFGFAKRYFRADVKRHKKHAKASLKARERKRKPQKPALEAEAQAAGKKIIDFDMKHVYLLGKKQYAFCAAGIRTKEAVVHVASTPSSASDKAALEKIVSRFGRGIIIITDNGSENMKDAGQYLAREGITQYWARPHQPKDKPFAERFIGTLQKECLDCNCAPLNVSELSAVVGERLDKYHNFRPHASPGMLTPAAYAATPANPVLPARSE